MKWRTLLLASSGIVLTLGLIGGVYFLTSKYLTQTARADHSGPITCDKTYTQHYIIIRNNVMAPIRTDARLCDILSITNLDDRLRLIAFGPHDHHVPYDGVTERVIDRGQTLTIVLNQPGTYRVHDHLQDDTAGTFTVANR